MSPTETAIVHRYDHALSFDRVTAACAACEGYWPCDLAGHKGFFTYSAIHDQEGWRCAPDCEHEAHSGRSEA